MHHELPRHPVVQTTMPVNSIGPDPTAPRLMTKHGFEAGWKFEQAQN